MAESGAHVLASQVGGHAGVMSTEDGSLVIKPALPRELEFYQKLQQDGTLNVLLPYTPRFLGTLKLEGSVDKTQPESLVVNPTTDKKESIVLENLSFPFLKPNILDVKLGTQLYENSAPPEKIERMKETARNTTSLETGIRLTGFQVYDNATGQPVNTPKSYGKSIKPAQLPEGISKFFPFGDSIGLPLDTLVPILTGIRDAIEEIRGVYASLEMRMVGGSLLVVYEGDRTRASAALKKYEECDKDEEDEDEEEEEDDDPATKIGPPFTVKMIDFAHVTFVPGQGPDAGVLLGMDNVVKLLNGRLDELQSA